MPAVTRVGDDCTGHGCFPPRPSVAGSPTVYANKIPIIRITDPYDSHCCGGCHDSILAMGSGTVFADKLNMGRIADPVECGSDVAVGSPDVFAGG